MTFYKCVLLAFTASLLVGNSAQANFHFMQIEQIIGGVNGDTTAQAIQLRMRSSGQNVVNQARVVAVNATGTSPVILKDMTTNVMNSGSGARILITTPNFANYTNIPLVSDFTMTPIPASYLAAGQVRFTDDSGNVYWSVSWGGPAGYTGSTSGFTNDDNNNFGPPVNIALPSTTLQALKFSGIATDFSTTNLAQYALTAGAATFVNNAGTSFIVTAPPVVIPGNYDGDTDVDIADYNAWLQTFGSTVTASTGADGNGNTKIDLADYAVWRDHVGQTAGSGGGAVEIPEPSTIALFLLGALGIYGHLRQRSNKHN